MATEKHKVYTCGDPQCDTEANSQKNIRIHQTKSGHSGEPRISTRKMPARVTRSQQAIARKKAAATTKAPVKKAPAKKSTPKKGPAKKATKRPAKKAVAKRAPARKTSKK